jgi:hypothetical protein
MINKDFLLNNISKIEHLTFNCGSCKNGVKVLDRTKYFESESGFSKREFTDDFNGFKTKIHKRFSAGFICSNPDCSDISILIGDINSVLGFEETKYQGELIEEPCYNDKIFFYDIIPTLDIFDTKMYSFKNENNSIENALKDVFSVFWRNADCCGMKIRTFLEVLMDDNCIDKTYIDKKGKEKSYPLHQRIDFFEKKYPNEDLKIILQNLKDFGNIGSHSGETLSREKLVIMLEIIECILNQLYVDNRKRLEELINKLNKNSA